MSFLAPLPKNLRMGMPFVLLATFFGAGRLPYAPGSWASFFALLLLFPVQFFFGLAGVLSFTVLFFGLGLWASSRYAAHSRYHDPRAVVIDEAAGQSLVLIAAEPVFWDYLWAFLLFRLFDIVKPWPISWAERRLPGALAIMGDDLAAALCAIALILLYRYGAAL